MVRRGRIPRRFLDVLQISDGLRPSIRELSVPTVGNIVWPPMPQSTTIAKAMSNCLCNPMLFSGEAVFDSASYVFKSLNLLEYLIESYQIHAIKDFGRRNQILHKPSR